MEVSFRIKVFCRKIWVTGKVGSLVNKTGTARVGEFGDILGYTSVYTKFLHLLYVLVGSVSKALMYELSSKVVSNYLDTWLKKGGWNVRV